MSYVKRRELFNQRSSEMELRSGTIVAATPPSSSRAAGRALSEEGGAMFQQGVGLLLARWTALQLAVHNEWGGPTSKLKAQQLHMDIVHWMVQSKVPRYVDELEDFLDENLIQHFNTETEDGSLEEVADKVMAIYEDCLDGNFEAIRELASNNDMALQSTSRSQQVEVESTEEEGVPTSVSDVKDVADMEMEEAESYGGSRPSLTAEEEADGWKLVSSKMKQKPQRR